MSEFTAHVQWQRQAGEPFTDQRYSRRHDWRFDGGATVPASSSPHSVPLPLSDPHAVDPEEALVAALSSCHMLWFLSLAAKAGWVVEQYSDDAVGVMGRHAEGKVAMTRVTLRPQVVFAGDVPAPPVHEALHHAAHAACYIANSVRCEVRCEPVAMALESSAAGTAMATDQQVADDLHQVLDELKQLEPLFHVWTGQATPPDVERLVAPDFWEVGASGRRYSRAFVLEVVEQRLRGPQEEAAWEASDWQVQPFGADHVLLTYTLRQPDRLTRRATVWRRTAGGWQAAYHQGTVVAPDGV